jgi:hypothetical protein
VTTEDWATFTAGVTLGATIELGSNISDQCVSSVATVLESAYLVGYYLSAYLVAESDEYVTYAAAYLLKMVQAGYDLSYCETYLNAYFPWLFTYSQMGPRLGQSVSDLYDMLDEIISIVGDAEDVIGVLEMVTDTTAIY